jgi:O-antigen/teichoic acid export membrane protein
VIKVRSYLVGSLSVAFLGFITLPIITWYYSVESIGRIAMLQVASNLVMLFFTLGLDHAYVREFYESKRRDELLRATMLPGIITLIIALIVCLAYPSFLSLALFDISSHVNGYIISLCFISILLTRYLTLVLRMRDRGWSFSLVQVIPKVLFLGMVFVYTLTSDKPIFQELLYSHAISIIVASIALFWLTRRDWVAALKTKINYIELKSLIRFSFPLIFSGLAFWVLTSVDRFFLKEYSTYDELGVYSVSASFASVAIVFQSVFCTVWMPTVYKWLSVDSLFAEENIKHTIKLVFVVVVIIFTLAGSLSWLVTYLLPEAYREVQYVLVSCLGFPLLYGLSEATAVGIGISKKTKYNLLATLLAMIANVAGNYMLVPLFGAAGAAVSTCISFGIFFILRTEFSGYLWMVVPRFNMYFWVVGLISVSAIGALDLFSLQNSINLFWTVFFIVFCVAHKDVLIELYRILRGEKAVLVSRRKE